jgi:competence CoiA-like predicted nuclease
MPFIAIDRDTGQRVDILKLKNPRLEVKTGQCVCQLCGQPLIVRGGDFNRVHFAHQTECGDSEWQRHPETPEHQQGKRYVAETLPQQFPEYREAVIEYEVKIVLPSSKRIADVLATFPTGQKVAHEVQFASITTSELEARTNDYRSAGVDVVWWLGRSAANPVNLTWCDETFGFSLRFDVQVNKEASTRAA